MLWKCSSGRALWDLEGQTSSLCLPAFVQRPFLGLTKWTDELSLVQDHSLPGDHVGTEWGIQPTRIRCAVNQSLAGRAGPSLCG